MVGLRKRDRVMRRAYQVEEAKLFHNFQPLLEKGSIKRKACNCVATHPKNVLKNSMEATKMPFRMLRGVCFTIVNEACEMSCGKICFSLLC